LNKIRDKANFIFGITVFILSLTLYFYSGKYTVFTRTGLGAGFAPKLIAILAGICSIFIIIRSVNNKELRTKIKKKDFSKTIIFIILTFFYIIVLSKLSYFFATTGFLFLGMLILYPHKYNFKNIVKLVIVSSAGGFLFSFVFENIFNIYI